MRASRGDGAVGLAVMLGALSCLAVPVGVAASLLTDWVDTLRGLEVAVPVGFVLGVVAVTARRAARRRSLRSVRPGGGRLRLASRLSWLGVYLALMGAAALGFYALLRLSE